MQSIEQIVSKLTINNINAEKVRKHFLSTLKIITNYLK